MTERYKKLGEKATALDTSYNFYRLVRVPLAARVALGGHVIYCGWNSNGFGKKLGFTLVEMLNVAHGLQHNDTMVTVECKTREGDWLS